MQTELVLQTKNRSGPAKNRFSVSLVWANSADPDQTAPQDQTAPRGAV